MTIERSDRFVVYVDGEVLEFTRFEEVPRHIAVAMGRELGISPICYLGSYDAGSDATIWDHLDVLADAAGMLGYANAGSDRLAALLLEHTPLGPSTLALVALLPIPTSHKAAPPGCGWFMHVEHFDPYPEADGFQFRNPLRLGISSHVRNHLDPSTRMLVWDDCALDFVAREAQSRDLDAMIIVNSEGRVASVGQNAIVIADGETLFTPPLGEGALDTAWRRRILYSGDVSEARVGLADVLMADRAFCLTPWGERLEIGAIESDLVDGTGDK